MCPAEGPAVWRFRVKVVKNNLLSDYSAPATQNLCPDLDSVEYYALTLNALMNSQVQMVWTDYLEIENGWRVLLQEVDDSEYVVAIVNHFHT